MTNCFAIRNGRTITTSVSLSMAKVSLPCGRERNLRISGVAMGAIAAGLIGIVLLVSLGDALVVSETS